MIISFRVGAARRLATNTNTKLQQNRYFASSSTSNNNSPRTPHHQHQRLRRSVNFVPADNLKFLTKSLSLGADTLIFDLEDSVKDKIVGRDVLSSFLHSADMMADGRKSEVLVRINPLSEDESVWKDDIQVGFEGGVDGFMVPKVESKDELVMLDELLTDMEAKHSSSSSSTTQHAPKLLLPIATETPLAVLNIANIARGPRVAAITWGCEDLSAEIGSYGTRNQHSGGYLDIFKHCQSMCLLAAKAANVQAIDGIYQNIRDMNGFTKEAYDAKFMGFDGKLTLHPDQINAVHNVFEPTDEELNEAIQIVSLWEGSDDSKGSLEYNGKMIDLPHYIRAKKVMARSTKGSEAARDTNNNDTTISMAGSGDITPQQQTPSKSKDEDNAIQEEVFPRVYLGKYFEELEPGLKIRHFLTRTVTESDNVFFTCLTLNPAPIHLDHELTKENSKALSGGAEGKPLFNSMFTLALLVGMSVPEVTHGTTIANLGFSEVKFPKPVYPGDTLRAETEVLDRRESKSRPTQGIVTLQHVAYNQRGEVVCKATRQALMKKRIAT